MTLTTIRVHFSRLALLGILGATFLFGGAPGTESGGTCSSTATTGCQQQIGVTH